jgi:hypothetical protein
MPAATRNRSTHAALGLGVLAGLALVLGVAIIAALLGQNGCQGASGSGGPPSKTARRDIPADLLALYQQIGPRYGIPWQILAGIGKEECDHARDPDPSCKPEPGQSGPGAANYAGAAGPMQIGTGGAAGDEFDQVKVDANGDGSAGTHDPADAIAMAARVLLDNKEAPRNVSLDAYRSAVRAYNGAGPAAEAYADRVLADAHAYANDNFATASAITTGTGCANAGLAGSGIPGKVIVAAGANRPGVALQPITLRYVAAMAGLYGKPIVISTGTNHDQHTVDGTISDHWDGQAADLAMAANAGTDGGPVGDALMAACLQIAGEPPRRAWSEARAGGLYTLYRAGLRIQCIWKTFAGGDHYTHVHVGVRPQ